MNLLSFFWNRCIRIRQTMSFRTRSRMRGRAWISGIARWGRTWRPPGPITCCYRMVGCRSSIISLIRMGIGRWCDMKEPPLIPLRDHRDRRDLGRKKATDIKAPRIPSTIKYQSLAKKRSIEHRYILEQGSVSSNIFFLKQRTREHPGKAYYYI